MNARGRLALATGVAETQPNIAIALRSLAVLVGYSRIHTGVDYPSDFAVGGLLGVWLSRSPSPRAVGATGNAYGAGG